MDGQLSIDDERRFVGRNHPMTAQAMQRKALPRSGSFRRALYDALVMRPSTDFELERLFRRSHQSVSGARATLKADGWVREHRDVLGHVITRRNEWANDAIVWEAVPE